MTIKQKIIGKYKLIELIDKGSFGEVWKALKNKKIYAIKIISKENLS